MAWSKIKSKTPKHMAKARTGGMISVKRIRRTFIPRKRKSVFGKMVNKE